MAVTYAQLAAVVTTKATWEAAETARTVAANAYQAACATVVAAGGGTLTASVGGQETVLQTDNGQVVVGNGTRLTA